MGQQQQQPLHRPNEKAYGCVSFARDVVSDIKSVPSRDAYPHDISDALWMRGEEYHKMVQKNMIEFLSEGCDPDQVLEEDNFILRRCILVHPVHLLKL